MNVDALKPWSIVSIRYCSTARDRDRIGPLAGRLVEVGGGVTERRVGLDDRQPAAPAVERGEHRRHDRGESQRLRAAGVVVEIDQRPQPEHGRAERQHRAQLGERLAADGRRGVDDRHRARRGRSAGIAIRRVNSLALGGRRQPPLVEEVPDLLERVGPGQRRRVEPAVVVEALVT